MRQTALVMAAVLATMPACTLLTMGAGAGITGIHNGVVDDQDEWGYTAPMVAGAIIGLAFDVLLLYALKGKGSKPMT